MAVWSLLKYQVYREVAVLSNLPGSQEMLLQPEHWQRSSVVPSWGSLQKLICSS
jgi:hypothetical protein